MITDTQTGKLNGNPVRGLPIEALPISENGWPLRPFQIVSLLDVINFPADQFLKASAMLAAINQVAENQKPNLIVSETNRQQAIEQLKLIKTLSEIMGLEYTVDEIDFILSKRLNEEGVTWREFGGLAMATGRRMVDETKRRLCMYVPLEDRKYFKQRALFGERVLSKFPSASEDIQAAGSCYATDNGTACVMHSMRVLELGIGALAKQFRISFQHTNWDKIIGQVEKKIGLIEKKRRKPKNWRNDRQFYSEAAIHFRFLKDAWRNYAMHIHEHYDKPSALTIMTHVHEFMDHLSERLGE